MPGMGTKTKYTFLVLDHNITSQRTEENSPSLGKLGQQAFRAESASVLIKTNVWGPACLFLGEISQFYCPPFCYRKI